MRSLLVCLAALAAFALPAATAGAATIVVNTTEPESTTQCGLVNAITAANTNAVSGGCTGGSFATPDRIEFVLPPKATIMLKAQLPTISSEMAIAGPGADALVISGGDASRVFSVGSTSASISGLTVADGKSKEGGGIFNGFGSSLRLEEATVRGNEATAVAGVTPAGGGIWNAGTLTLVRSTVAENVVRSTSGMAAEGGGIFNLATLQIEASTIEANEVVSTTSGGAFTRARGGGVFNEGELTVLASTLRGNKASASGGTLVNETEGAGIEITLNSETTIARSTVAGNIVLGSGGGLGGSSLSLRIFNSTFAANSAGGGANISSAFAELRSTIIAKPLGGGESCSSPLKSLGYNLAEDERCLLFETKPTDQLETDPLLGPLAANGGPTATMAPLPGSPAIDAGSSAAGETTDQRGLLRPLEIASVPNAAGGDGTDVGAFEVQAPRATIVSGPAEGATIDERRPSFGFVAEDPLATFACTLDGAAAVPCASPYQLPELAPGPHSFSVGALDAAGHGQPPASRSFTVRTPPPSGESKPEPARTEPPRTEQPSAAAPRPRILALPAKTIRRQLKIQFAADQPGSSFSCKLDRRPWRSCLSPFSTPQLLPGRHSFQVKATGPTGIPGASAASKSFQVLAPRR